MPTAQAPKMIRNSIQIIFIRRSLLPRIIICILHRRLSTINTGRERRGHVVRQLEALEREIDVLVDLVGEGALEGEALELDEQDGREPGKG